MAQLRVNGRVPGKKQKKNPWTMTGLPMWGTFQGLGMPSAAKELNKHAKYRAKGLPGRRSRFKKGKRLDPSNLCHRSHESVDRARGHFDRLRVLSLHIDRMNETPQIDRAMKEYNERLLALVQLHQTQYIDELIRLEAARGVRRAARFN